MSGSLEAARRALASPEVPNWAVLCGGLTEAMTHGHFALFRALLATSSVVRSAAQHHAERLLKAAAQSGREEAFEALLGIEISLTKLAEAWFYLNQHPWHRTTLSGIPGLPLKALSLALEAGKDRMVEVEPLLAQAPEADAPDFLHALWVHSQPGSSGSWFASISLPHVMALASRVRSAAECRRPCTAPSWDEVVLAVSAGAPSSKEVWVRRWVGWMVPAETLAGGERWSDLHRCPMPNSARAGYWMALAARLSGDGLDTVPESDRSPLMQAVLVDAMTNPLNFIPEAISGCYAALDPLNTFLAAWRAHSYPELGALAAEHRHIGMIQKLMEFGSDPNVCLTDGETVIQKLARHPQACFWSETQWKGFKIDWSVKSAQGENLVHLLCGDASTSSKEEVGIKWFNVTRLLGHFVSNMQSSAWSEADAQGRTPWAALRDFRVRLGLLDTEWWSWMEKNSQLIQILKTGDESHALNTSLPEASPCDSRQRI